MGHFVFIHLNISFCIIYLEMPLEEDAVLCIEVEDDSSFLWNDVLIPWHIVSGGLGRFSPKSEKRISMKR